MNSRASISRTGRRGQRETHPRQHKCSFGLNSMDLLNNLRLDLCSPKGIEPRVIHSRVEPPGEEEKRLTVQILQNDVCLLREPMSWGDRYGVGLSDERTMLEPRSHLVQHADEADVELSAQ